MKRLIFIIIFLWGSVAALAQTSNVVSIEVFFDNDPGVGLGAIIPPGVPDSVINELIAAGADTLAPGFHTLGIRVATDYTSTAEDTLTYPGSQNPQLGSGTQSSNYDSTYLILDPVPKQWSVTEYRSFYVGLSSAAAVAAIDSVEYFFDSDPGVGLGIGVPITPGDSIDILQNLASDTLSPGFHTLGVRVKDANGSWGVTEYKAFMVGSSSAVTVASIDSIEYFFDFDPGVGSAAGISIASADSIDLLMALASDTLLTGFHILGIRVRDVNSTWSHTEYRSFIVGSSGTVTIANIDSIEYFFDTDPGIGNGIPLSITETDSLNVLINLAADTLSTGFHSLGLRVQDVDGNWSITEYKSFIVGSSGAVTIANIDSIEYFFDSDPGIGNGIPLSVTETDSLNVLINLTADTLSTGFHSLGLRVQDVDGNWSITEYKSFIVGSSGAVTIANIDSIEYFFDSDPGIGNGIPLSVTETDSLNVLINLAADTLSTGFHSLGLRVQDVDGNWSVTDYKSFIVGSSGAVTIANIDSIEYFFDTDPGVGNGIGISVPASDSINITPDLASDTLSTGFHVVGTRVRDENGNWGITDYKAIYIESSELAFFTPLTQLEYFYDDDPGYGSGTFVPAAVDSIEIDLNIPSPATPGVHTLTVRALNENGIWGIGEVVTVYSFVEGRDLDSMALVEVFKLNNGENWTDNTGWTTGDLDTWYGVGIHPVSFRVDSLNLSGNGLTGGLPLEFGYATRLRTVDLSGNALTDSIPYNFPTYLDSLKNLNISDNQLNGLPDLSGLTNMQAIKAENNFFDFGDLEPNVSVLDTYSPQGPTTNYLDTVVNIGQLVSFDVVMGGLSNTFQWYKDSTLLAGSITASFFIPSVAAVDSGQYYCLIDNSQLTDLQLSTNMYHAKFSSFTTDSLALVSLYNSTDGANWTNNTNWLSGDVSTWNGVTVASGNVREVQISSNNLIGTIPDDIYYLDSIRVMDLSDNTIDGYIPGSVIKMNNLEKLLLQNNEFDSLPNLSLSPPDTLDISGNRLHFEDLEVNLAIPTFIYTPQDSVGESATYVADAGSNFTLEANVRGANNTYQWILNGNSLGGQTGTSLNIVGVTFEDEGYYTVEVKNSIVTGLTIYTLGRELRVSSLERDSLALVNLYETTGGDNWTDKTGWDASSRGALNTWVGVLITDNRISELDLPDNNLTGEIVDKIREITQLIMVDLSGNKLDGVPFIGGGVTFAQLDTFDVRDNQLGFEYIEPNLVRTEFIYNPQDSLLGNESDTVFVGSTIDFVARTYSANNTYQWMLDDIPIAGATDSVFSIVSMERDSMGVYMAKITNSVVTDMDMYTKPARIMAKASVAGAVTAGGSPVTAGEMRIFKINEVGGFDTTAIASIDANGDYLIEDLILDDYVLVADADDGSYADLVPTYYGNTIYWEEADTIPLTNDVTQIDIPFFEEPAESTGAGSLEGTVEEDLVTGGRLLGRRKVSKATVTIKKVAGEQRTLKTLEDEVVAVAYTDENGQFLMPKLEAGTYDFNVQYPGIPMDESTFTTITIGEEEANRDVQVLCTVTLDGIIVEDITVVGLRGELAMHYKVYPNPASLSVTIENIKFNGELSKIILIDVNGRMVLDEPFVIYERIHLDVSSLKNGVYILKVMNKQDEPIGIARILINR